MSNCALLNETNMGIRLVTENGKFVAGIDPAHFSPSILADPASPPSAVKADAIPDASSEYLPHGTRLEPADLSRPLLMSVAETMRELRIGRTKVFDLARTGELERVHIGRCTRYTTRSVLALAEGK